MVILGICSEHNSAAALMIDGMIVGIIQEERLTKRKNQVALPLRAIERLVQEHLGGNFARIDRVVFGTKISEPFFSALDRYSDFEVLDHVREMHEYWWPYFHGRRDIEGRYWKNEFAAGRHLNRDHNYDFSFLRDMSFDQATQHFSLTVRPETLRRHYQYNGPIDLIDHHECHTWYAVYGGRLTEAQRRDALVLTADGWGDDLNWSVSVTTADGGLERIAAGSDHKVARIYKFVTLILGMKPNEHEYKVMGLSAYTQSRRHIEPTERIFLEALDFRDGRFVSDRPLVDSYFDLKERLEGHRFDNIAAAVQSWSTRLTCAWAQHWLRKSGRRTLCFSGGLSMNIKTNGELLRLPEVDYLSVPASGGDESLCAGACFSAAASGGERQRIAPMDHAYLGDDAAAIESDWSLRLGDTGCSANDFEVREDIDAAAAAKLLAADCIVARCVGRSEFGARALGNRSILANPGNPENVKIINHAIKNRDFWMPFTPSILREHADEFVDNPKEVSSPFMTIGFGSKPDRRRDIVGALHAADYSARPQFVDRQSNPDYWALIEAFRRLTGIPALLNTSLNLHGEPMNYTVADAARTVALSDLDFLLIPGNRLLFKKRAAERLNQILGRQFQMA
ncbi:MAG: hypothetical protein FJX62_03075 [Alphaproteobacteria bacterium]|nr:hypothetical protein [Alphaproteobacteria bacterium]